MVEMEKWGKDHWSLLAYVECRCVDDNGKLDKRSMRCNENNHPMHKIRLLNPSINWQSSYSTKLKNGNAEGHDDWDCLDDLESAALIEIISVVNGFVKITDKGKKLAHQVRDHKSEGGSFSTFSV